MYSCIHVLAYVRIFIRLYLRKYLRILIFTYTHRYY
uniref:Uncharacterized protein n=1 Tax=Siphoviridae sp. ctMOb8 TaxID=2825460 RepID=A0A8S5PZG7_9CAUD|nr:MAG TPA: hypothetical protein [Siphoviridae sp. ctMOb8]